MKIPKICSWYRIVPVTYKIAKTHRWEDLRNGIAFFGYAPIVMVIEYQIQKKNLFGWRYIRYGCFDPVQNFKSQDDAINYIIAHNKGRVVNLIRC
jgi:hypothetical protein